MSEEEIIQELKVLIGLAEYNRLSYKENKAIQGLLDLYQQEKEKNKKLIDGQVETIEKIIQPELFKKYISKEKIREKIKEYEKPIKFSEIDKYGEIIEGTMIYRDKIEALQELLEERD